MLFALAPAAGRRGADTRVCSAETRLGALLPFSCARPAILLRPPDQPRFHGVVFDVCHNSFPLLVVSDPMVVRLRLPKRLSRAAQNTIRLPRRRPFEGLQQSGW